LYLEPMLPQFHRSKEEVAVKHHSHSKPKRKGIVLQALDNCKKAAVGVLNKQLAERLQSGKPEMSNQQLVSVANQVQAAIEYAAILDLSCP
jgi:hypothetical protein